jgi:hypothetical protein
MKSKSDHDSGVRPVAREFARELTAEEIKSVSGAGRNAPDVYKTITQAQGVGDVDVDWSF